MSDQHAPGQDQPMNGENPGWPQGDVPPVPPAPSYALPLPPVGAAPYQPPAAAQQLPPYAAAPYPQAPSYPQTPSYPQAAPYAGQTPVYQPAQPYGDPAQAYGAPVRPTSGAAIASLVCGLAGLLLSWLGIPLLASIAAVITGHIALRQIKRRPELGGKGMAIAGLILGYVTVAFLVLAVVGGIIALVTTGVVLYPHLLDS